MTNNANVFMTMISVPISSSLIREICQWRHYLHQYPEVEFGVFKTAEFVSEKLKSWGMEVHEKIGVSGVVGVLRKGDFSQGSIALRADMDALPILEENTFNYKSKNKNKMHACGHDGHTAMLLGAAKHLTDHGKFNGTVYFIFQPNEENGLGAKAMIDDGLFQKFPADRIYGLHNVPGLEEGVIALRKGPIMASESLFEICIHAKGGHASSPHMCIDPLIIGSQIILHLQTIVSRNADPLDSVVVSVTEFISDGKRNVIPSNVVIKGDCRTFDENNTNLIELKINDISNHLCEANGASCEVTFLREFPVTVNSYDATAAAEKAAIATNGIEKVHQDCLPKSFSEDFAHYLHCIPGCYIFIGNGVNSQGGCMLHNPNYDFNDDISSTGVTYWCTLVEQQLS